MNDQTIRFRLGIFVLGSLICLGILILLFGGFPRFFKQAQSYTIVLNNAQGIGPGTPVRRSGVKIGEVRSLKLDNDTGKVLVNIQIDEGFTIRKSDRPTLVQGFLGSDTSISFVPPPPAPGVVFDETPVEPGSTLVGFTQADAGAVLQKTADLMPTAQDALNEIKVFVQKLDKFTPTMEEAVKEVAEVARSTNKAIPSFTKTADSINDLAIAAQAALPDVRRVTDEVELAARNWGRVGERMDILVQTNQDKVTKTLDRAQESLARLNEILNDENQKAVRDILRNVRTSSERFDTVLNNTDDLIRQTKNTMKSVDGALEKTTQVLDNLDKASKPFADHSDTILRNLDSSTQKLDRVLGEVSNLLDGFGKTEGSVQKLLTDPSLYRNLNEAADKLNKLLPRVDYILRDVEIFADKIARHPESLGIGGAVHPSSGLKEAPTVQPWHIGQ